MADEFHGFSGNWWSSMRCNSVKKPQDLCFDNSPGSCVTFQESHLFQPSNQMAAMDSSLQLSISDLSPSSVDQWAQSFIAEGSEQPYTNLKDTSQDFLNIDPSSSESNMKNLPLLSPSGFSLLDNLLAFEARPHQQENSSAPPLMHQRDLWSKNKSSDFYSLIEPMKFIDAGFEEKSDLNKSTSEVNSEENTSSSNSSRSKKPRIATPSPLPTFKVRKEKLGDRVTALQQLVSPFGKTDTASVLHEAIEYIKFLHDQVRTLSSPYLRNSSQTNHQQNSERSKDSEDRNQQLRNRGLCLVPISSTFAVACSDIPPIDFWTPPFGMFSYT